MTFDLVLKDQHVLATGVRKGILSRSSSMGKSTDECKDGSAVFTTDKVLGCIARLGKDEAEPNSSASCARYFSIVGSVLGSRNKDVNFFSHELGGWD